MGPGWQARLRFPTAAVPGPREVPLCVFGERRAFRTVGVMPHLVLEVDDVAAVPLAARGRRQFAPRRDPRAAM
ncbi:MAG: hypothetical protein R2882_07110 [Gemmatimonadales bacterium]